MCMVFSFMHLVFSADILSAQKKMDAYMSTVYGKSLGGAGYTYYKNGYGIASGCHAFVNQLWHSAFGYDTYDSVCYTTDVNYQFSNIGTYIQNNATVGDILRFDCKSGNRKYVHSVVIREIGADGIKTYEYGGPRHYFSDGPISEYYSYKYLANYYGNGGGYYFLYKSTASPSSSTYADTHPEAVHVHTYVQKIVDAHPHSIYMQCACGDFYYTGEYVDIEACTVCHPPVIEAVEVGHVAVVTDAFSSKYVWSRESTNLDYDKWLCKMVSNNNCDNLKLYMDVEVIPPIKDNIDTEEVNLKINLEDAQKSIDNILPDLTGDKKLTTPLLSQESCKSNISEIISKIKDIPS